MLTDVLVMVLCHLRTSTGGNIQWLPPSIQRDDRCIAELLGHAREFWRHANSTMLELSSRARQVQPHAHAWHGKGDVNITYAPPESGGRRVYIGAVEQVPTIMPTADALPAEIIHAHIPDIRGELDAIVANLQTLPTRWDDLSALLAAPVPPHTHTLVLEGDSCEFSSVPAATTSTPLLPVLPSALVTGRLSVGPVCGTLMAPEDSTTRHKNASFFLHLRADLEHLRRLITLRWSEPVCNHRHMLAYTPAVGSTKVSEMIMLSGWWYSAGVACATLEPFKKRQ